MTTLAVVDNTGTVHGMLDGKVFEAAALLANAGMIVTALELDRPLPYNTTVALARCFGVLDRSGKWWVGDLLLHAEQTHGELFAQVAHETGLAEHTLQNRMSVCRAIPPGERKAGVGFSFHAEVAYLPRSQRRELLERAEAQGMTVAMLRALLKPERQPVELVPNVGKHVG